VGRGVQFTQVHVKIIHETVRVEDCLAKDAAGNGAQLLYRVDLPADDGGLVQRCLQALQPCSTNDVHVDLSVHNPARICRLPGTWNRKGPDAFMPHWELARRLSWPEKKIQDVRESLLAQERIELKPSSRGPIRPQYRLK